MSDLEQVSSHKAFGGELIKFKFLSAVLGHTIAKLNVFIPSSASHSSKSPVLIFLSGMECTEDQSPQKGGLLKDAEAEGIAIVFPDTSPRGAGVEGEDDDWTFGTGAGHYIDATVPKYSKFYNMETHVRREIPDILGKHLPLDFSRQSLSGQSMGGHGSLTLYLKALGSSRPYLSASAFAPAANPTKSSWGHTAFKGYLKNGIEEGKAHDATELISKVQEKVNILIDMGDADQWDKRGELLIGNFVEAARKSGHSSDEVNFRIHPGYDHGYYFISSFASDHIKFHAKILKGETANEAIVL